MSFAESLINLIFPRYCLHCSLNLKKGVICQSCFGKIPLNKNLFCGLCRNRIPGVPPPTNLNRLSASNIVKFCHKSFLYILGSASSYNNDILKNLICSLKFQFIKDAALPLGELLSEYFSSLRLCASDFSVVPIPLSNKRMQKRGFNQSLLIAQVFAEKQSLEIISDALFRAKDTLPQSELSDYQERQQNVKDCFVVKNIDKLKGKNIILIDDVTTSGATLKEAASVLKKVGVRKIIALTVALA